MKSNGELQQIAKDYVKPFKHTLHLGEEEGLISDLVSFYEYVQGFEQQTYINVTQPDKPGEVMTLEECKDKVCTDSFNVSFAVAISMADEDDLYRIVNETAELYASQYKHKAEETESDLKHCVGIANGLREEKEKAEQHVSGMRESFKAYVDQTGLSESDKNLVKGVFYGWVKPQDN